MFWGGGSRVSGEGNELRVLFGIKYSKTVILMYDF